ncbi:hypothetical protein H6M51_10915 [Rhizobium sp. AQ_MP]|uniref:ATP-binding protein n=1 Tax=Rhizobium sp. AQ_MP TaxID=2761536 RepID=UPI00163AE4DE|nr:ATP-binding protein [Rhizobium sp. AQ_MP]MBC2773378.1 hypothetical protein [Rhizobium sp. AQ_MP]
MALHCGEFNPEELPACKAESLVAYLELAHVFPEFTLAGSRSSWLEAPLFCRYITDRDRAWFVQEPFTHGYVPVSTIIKKPYIWMELINRINRVGAQAGFSYDHTGKFVAAIGELWSNIIDHSQKIDTGYIGLKLTPGLFEFVVADHGVGILASLNSNPKHESLRDHGRAIELALSEGVSRYDDREGHGYGFRPLFTGLANIARDLRFRSGDHARVITRVDSGQPEARTYQLAPLTGFFCSVTCTL